MKSLRKTFAILIAFVLLLSAVPIGPVSADDAPTVIPDGEYAIGFRYVKDGTTQTSAANQFVLLDTGKLIVEDGQATFEHEITKEYYATFAYLGSRKAGAAKAVISSSGGQETVSGLEGYQPVAVRDAANPNNVVVSFYIEDVWKKQDILIHIYDKDNIFQMNPVYNHWYNAQLELNLDNIDLTPPEEEEEEEENGDEDTVVTIEMFNERAAVGRALYESAREGEFDGFYPIGSRAELYDSIVTAERIAASAGDNAELLKAAYTILDEAIKKFESLRIVVNKSKLIEWIQTASAWAATAADGGTAESGKPGHPNQVAVSDGEYPADTGINPISGPATKVRASIAQAQSV